MSNKLIISSLGRLFPLFVLLAGSLPIIKADSLEATEDSELSKLISGEQFVVVLFDRPSGGDPSDHEMELASIREDLVDSLNAWVVKSHNTEIASGLDPTHKLDEKPLIAFYRGGIPVLYQGPANDEEMLETLIRYKDACVKDLTDASFEHLTQAATGATTGDWFVLFYKEQCAQCYALFPRLETLGCQHKNRINVAKVNRGTTGAVTGRRFNVADVPALIFFRQGRMYRYELEKFDVESLSNFITGFYKNVKGESIPLPKSPFDDLVQLCVDYLRDYPFLFIGLAGLPILLSVAFYYLTKSEEPKPKKKKKKKSN